MNKKVILASIIGLVVGITGTVIASNYLASEIVYNDTTVESALNELYTTTNELKEYNENNKIVKGKAYLVNGKYTLDVGFLPTHIILTAPDSNGTKNCVYSLDGGSTWFLSVTESDQVYSWTSYTRIDGTTITLDKNDWTYEYMNVYAIK